MSQQIWELWALMQKFICQRSHGLDCYKESKNSYPSRCFKKRHVATWAQGKEILMDVINSCGKQRILRINLYAAGLWKCKQRANFTMSSSYRLPLVLSWFLSWFSKIFKVNPPNDFFSIWLVSMSTNFLAWSSSINDPIFLVRLLKVWDLTLSFCRSDVHEHLKIAKKYCTYKLSKLSKLYFQNICRYYDTRMYWIVMKLKNALKYDKTG